MTVQSTRVASNATEDTEAEEANLSSEEENAVDFNNSNNIKKDRVFVTLCAPNVIITVNNYGGNFGDAYHSYISVF